MEWIMENSAVPQSSLQEETLTGRTQTRPSAAGVRSMTQPSDRPAQAAVKPKDLTRMPRRDDAALAQG